MLEPSERSADDRAAAKLTAETTRGVGRHLVSRGYAVLTEFTLANNRRADVIGLSDGGTFAIVEVKVSVADLRSDTKWPEYEDFCDRLYFAVPPGFPSERAPKRAGLIIADSWGGEIVREASGMGLHGSRRKALTLHFARAAAQRHQRLVDPRI